MRVTDLQSYYVGLHLHDGMVNTDNRAARPRYQSAINRGSILARHRDGSTGREQAECVGKHKQGVLKFQVSFSLLEIQLGLVRDRSGLFFRTLLHDCILHQYFGYCDAAFRRRTDASERRSGLTKSPGAILNMGAKRPWPRRGGGQDARSKSIAWLWIEGRPSSGVSGQVRAGILVQYAVEL